MSIVINGMDMPKGNSTKNLLIYSDGRVFTGHKDDVNYFAEERNKGQFIGTEYDGYADGNPVYYEWKCSCCGAIFEDDEPTYNYCPNCGADMKGDEDEID